jgi:hypothetical protein
MSPIMTKQMFVVMVALLSGCTAQNPAEVLPDPGPGAPAAQGLTYYQSVAPILGAKCVTCHSTGGIAPFTLTSYDDAKTHAQAIAIVMQNHTMPPLPPKQLGCQPLDDERNMADADRATLMYWANGDRAEGDAANPAPVVPPPDILGPATVTVDSGIDYLSTYAGQDAYRCFVIDPKLTGTFPMIAADTTSTNRSIVHHVIVYAALPQNVAAAQALDAADPGPGYECFGGAGFAGAIPVGASAVGSKAKPFPEGSGIPLPAGTQFVVQVHYNFDNGRGSNRLALELWKATAPLTQVPHGMALANTTFFIPANAPDVDATANGEFMATPSGNGTAKPGKIWQVFPHMHQLGRSIYVELQRADGSKECLMNIDGNWDFHWQGSYQFQAPVIVNAGDKVQVTCTWDNSQDHQPIVNGVPQTSHDVHFGEGSTDEMCLTGLTLTN